MLEIFDNGDVHCNGSYIGSVCYKSHSGRWTAYLATENGDLPIGQYPTKDGAALVVAGAHDRLQIVGEWVV
ncbi:hypothetical protein N836_31640 [Leptolyngbya sp. Heron Island J]|uniref:hypothetical protein n=1 Tax=Leptolyngbya sp. Heron Island J TaxID=1385935 RepID=UPI0003B9698A|nr:hypothetical protein [Leptolyngbya sp. Heron Island J]ESA38495.1 hypothetical protein N836_31640 [Leptolyngbya sp. Heron Island J]